MLVLLDVVLIKEIGFSIYCVFSPPCGRQSKKDVDVKQYPYLVGFRMSKRGRSLASSSILGRLDNLKHYGVNDETIANHN